LTISALFIWIRATLPRIRYDNLIYLTWKCFLPTTLGILMLLVPLLSLINWHCAGRTDNSDDVKYGLYPVSN
jgi:NADH:ubiquinone oxidoreductase subunit H